MTEINDRWFTVANKTANTFELSGEDGTSHTAFTSGGTAAKVYEITTPWSDTEADDAQWAQNGDILYLTHTGYMVRKLVRTSDTSWTISTVDFTNGPYKDVDTSGITVTPSATTGAITVTASSALFDANDSTGGSGTGEIDRLIRIKHTSAWGWGKITSFSNSTSVTVTLEAGLDGSGTAAAAFQMGSFSTTSGFPRAVHMFEQRLMLGYTSDEPQGVWGSATGLPEDMSLGATSTDALDFTIVNRDQTAIQWLGSLNKELFCGTLQSEIHLNGNDTALTPASPPSVRPISFEGSRPIVPAFAGEAILFVDRSAKSAHSLSFSSTSARSTVDIDDLNWHADDLATAGIIRIAYQKGARILWCVLNDGDLAALTYDQKHDTLAWHTHQLGGSGDVESICVIPNSGTAGGSDSQVWVTVKRTINSVTHRYVEYLDTSVFADSAVVYSGAAVGSLTNLHHLEGESLSVKADSAKITDKTVASGSISFGTDTYTDVEAGLAFTHTLVTQADDINLAEGTLAGLKRRIHRIILRLVSSLGSTINGNVILYRKGDDPMDSAPPVFTGDKDEKIENEWSREGVVTISGSDPYPFELSSYVTSTVFNQE